MLLMTRYIHVLGLQYATNVYTKCVNILLFTILTLSVWGECVCVCVGEGFFFLFFVIIMTNATFSVSLNKGAANVHCILTILINFKWVTQTHTCTQTNRILANILAMKFGPAAHFSWSLLNNCFWSAISTIYTWCTPIKHTTTKADVHSHLHTQIHAYALAVLLRWYYI